MTDLKPLDYIRFLKTCAELIGPQRHMVILFLVLSVGAALTEGLGVSLVIPILEAEKARSGFAEVPVIGYIAQYFEGMPVGDKLEIIAILLAVVLMLRGVLLYATSALGNLIPQRLATQMSINSFDSTMRTNMLFMTGTNIGDLRNGVSELPERVSRLLLHLSTLISQGCIMTVYLVMMLVLSWKLTVISFVVLYLISLGVKVIAHVPLKQTGLRLTGEQARYNMLLHETFNGIKTIRLAAADRLTSRLHRDLRMNVYSVYKRQIMLAALGGPLTITAAGLFIAAVLFGAAAFNDATETSWVTSLILLVFLLSRVVGPVSIMNQSRALLIGELHALDALQDFLDRAEQEKQRDGDVVLDAAPSEICFENVAFTYPNKRLAAVNGVSFKLKKGEMVAVVGPSGSGKTTLTALLARLYDPDDGRITVDGRDLKSLSIDSWRRNLGTVSQDTFLFDDTIRNNICFGRENVSDDELDAAIRFAAADAFILELPQGLETYIGDRGVRLSGGQQQRLSIARAILANPAVLIFDEATSNLDPFTEKAIQTAMSRLRHKQTMFIVAHRLSTIKLADVILVMDKGRIIEHGPHTELIARNGVYSQMLANQAFDLVGPEI